MADEQPKTSFEGDLWAVGLTENRLEGNPGPANGACAAEAGAAMSAVHEVGPHGRRTRNGRVDPGVRPPTRDREGLA